MLKEKFVFVILKLFASFFIGALSELKFFYIEFIIIFHCSILLSVLNIFVVSALLFQAVYKELKCYNHYYIKHSK